MVVLLLYFLLAHFLGCGHCFSHVLIGGIGVSLILRGNWLKGALLSKAFVIRIHAFQNVHFMLFQIGVQFRKAYSTLFVKLDHLRKDLDEEFVEGWGNFHLFAFDFLLETL